MNCHNCGKNIWPEFNECPYCKADAHSEIDNEAVEIEEDEDSSVLELGMSSPVGIDDESPIQSDDFYSDDYDLNSLGKIIKARALMLFDSNKNGWEKIIEEEIKAP